MVHNHHTGPKAVWPSGWIDRVFATVKTHHGLSSSHPATYLPWISQLSCSMNYSWHSPLHSHNLFFLFLKRRGCGQGEEAQTNGFGEIWRWPMKCLKIWSWPMKCLTWFLSRWPPWRYNVHLTEWSVTVQTLDRRYFILKIMWKKLVLFGVNINTYLLKLYILANSLSTSLRDSVMKRTVCFYKIF